MRQALLFPLSLALAVACVGVILVATPLLLLLDSHVKDENYAD